MVSSIDELIPLSTDKIMVELGDLPGWEYVDSKISKLFEFKNFTDVVIFILSLTPYFNLYDHHPDITINYKKATFSLTRYDIGGKVTSRDIKVANQIESEFNRIYL